MTECAAVLQVEVEAGDISELGHRGRGEGEDHRFPDLRKRAHRPAGDGFDRQLLARPLVPWT